MTTVASSTPEIAVFDGIAPPANERTDNTGTFGFGSVNTGSSSAAQTFTLRNDGTADLTGIAVTKAVTGNPGDFTVNTAGMLTTLTPNATTTFTVTFSPTAATARSAVVQIASNDGDENPFEINVSGTGVSASVIIDFESLVSASSGDVPSPYTEDGYRLETLNSSAFYRWGTAEGRFAGSTSIFHNDFNGITRVSKVGGGSFDLTSINLAEVTSASVANVTFTGTRADNSTVSQTFTLDGNAFVHQTFTFPGGFNNLVKVEWAQVNPFHQFDNIVINGAPPAAVPEIAVEQPAGTDWVDGDTFAMVEFDAVDVAETTSKTFTIRNTGTGPLSIGAITFDGGAGAGYFSVTTPPPASIAAGDTGTFVVTFAPRESGSLSAWMRIVNGDADETPFDIRLRGYGTDFFGNTWMAGGTPLMVVPPSGDFYAGGLYFATELGFVPTVGVPYVFLDIQGPPPAGIIDFFNDLPEGGVVAMAGPGGEIYYMQATYTGGTGNDLVLTRINTGAPAWTWIAGPKARNGAGRYGDQGWADPGNNPGARQGAMQWLDEDGRLFLFGGYGYGASVTSRPRYLNDLWIYDRELGQWIWASGSNAGNAPGNYTPMDPDATPGARHTGTTWFDPRGFLWLFGGFGPTGRHNDLWSNRGGWVHVKGSETTDQPGFYGTQGVSDAANTPGARQGAVSWYTPGGPVGPDNASGTLWLFGGTSDGGTTNFNDLWRFDIGTEEWTWVSGSSGTNSNGTYTAVNAPGMPSARRDATSWTAKDGTLWLFGGRGCAATGTTLGDMSDVWRYNPANNVWTWMSGPSTHGAAGTYTALNSPGTPAARSGGSGWRTVDGKFWLVGGFRNSAAPLNDVWILDPGTGIWTWKLGSSTPYATGTYGIRGEANAANSPSARFTPSTWVTLNGDLWLFGGGGIDGFGGTGRMSDLWSYGIPNPAGAPYEPIPDAFPDSMIVNAAPSAHDASAETMASMPVSGQLTGFDADRDPLLFSAVSSTISQGILTLNSDGSWTYTPAPGFTGSTSFQFKASDNYGGQSPVRTLVVTVKTNPTDADGNGIADSYELSTFGATGVAADGDADLDGQSNYFEFLAGTDPLDASERLATAPSVAGTSGSGGTIKLQLTHVRPGVNYHLETSGDLDTWTRLGTFTFSEAGSAEIEDPTPATGAPKFYRMELEATPAVVLP